MYANKANEAACTVVLASGGYPSEFEKGFEINFENEKSDALIFHAGTQFNQHQKVITAGGRVLMVTALDNNLKNALKKAMTATSEIDFKNKYFRKDIGLDVC